MNIWAWIGIGGFIVLTLLTFLDKKQRTKQEITKAAIQISIAICIILAVVVFDRSFIEAMIVGYIAMILLDKKTYTKKRLLIYSSIVVVIGGALFYLFRDNPDHIVNHLKEHPDTSSLFFAENGKELISYEANVVRPLASTVKMLIAVEYSMQIQENKIKKDQLVSLDELKRYYIENTDGNAHKEWLKMLKREGKIKYNQVLLHDVAKGMITYSSNANTDYLMNLLGIEAINERAKTLGLTNHEQVYPVVSALLISEQIKEDSMSEKELIQAMEEMPMEEYRALAKELSQQMKDGTINAEKIKRNPSLSVQRVWSDRLIGASAKDYGKLMAVISNNQLPALANETVRDLLEWPMQMYEENREHFKHFGAKGGSTAFVLNDARYMEDHDGNKVELVILMDGLNVLKRILIEHNINSFESKLLRNEEYRQFVQKELSS